MQNKNKDEDIVRVLRIVEYVGPRSWVEDQVSRSIQGTKVIVDGPRRKMIHAVTIGSYPGILQGETGEADAK
jgi:hypothetical protein